MWAILKLLASNSSVKTLYPQLSKLAMITLILPVSTAECERCFSAMNRIKTDLRNRLFTITLDSLIRISIEGPSLDDFNFEKVFQNWSSM